MTDISKVAALLRELDDETVNHVGRLLFESRPGHRDVEGKLRWDWDNVPPGSRDLHKQHAREILPHLADYLEQHARSAPEVTEPSRDELIERIAWLESQLYVPGAWRCAKCDFSLFQGAIRASDGAIGARDEPGEKCPNCHVPLWRVTERQAGNEMVDRADEYLKRAVAAEAEVARLNTWADGFSDAQLKERRLCEELLRERESQIKELIEALGLACDPAHRFPLKEYLDRRDRARDVLSRARRTE